MARIVIDAGHGGADSGAAYMGRLEKDDNLRLALAVGNILKSAGQNVIYTRDSDVFVPLLERVYISNSNNADAFVSLHRNAHENPAAHGVENFVRVNPSANDVTFATNVLNNIVDVGVQANRGLKQENFTVLRYTLAPAQLLELGFITNAVDNALFDRNFNEYALATANGILTSLGLPEVGGGDPIMKSIQETLNQRYNAGLVVDGFFGPATKRVMIKGVQTELNRQYNAGLVVDGVWGPKTRSAVRTLRRGDASNLVYLLQAGLYANGFKTSTLDGIFGPDTEKVVRNFQLSKGLSVDGVAGPQTFDKIFA